MIREIYLTIILIVISIAAFGQQQKNMSLVGQKTYTQELSDVWAYVDTAGKEYALVGVFNGTSIVDVSTPTNPVEKFFIPGPNSTWRDLKVWGNYAYVTNESSGGLLIIDMTYMPDSIKTYTWSGNNGVSFSKAHNIWIDENGFAYIFGANFGIGGVIVADLANPISPNVKTVYNHAYVHDGFVRGDTMYLAEIYEGQFSIVDISNKNVVPMPQSTILATHPTPSSFTHNIWPSDDNSHVFTTDEVSAAYIGAYNISDLGNIQETDRIQNSPGSGVIPHNVLFHNDFLVTAYYRDGVTIMDATYPENVVLTGWYDTSPLSGSGFNGSWGVYPYLPSGLILATDIENGLIILSANYERAAYLQGVVTDSITNSPIFGAYVQITGHPDADDNTSLLGKYYSGVADSGSYTVTVMKAGYATKVFNNITLDNGVITQLDVELVPLVPFAFTGQVVDSITGQGIAGAQVLFTSQLYNYTATADNAGNFSIPGFYEDKYEIYAGSWGYKTEESIAQDLDNTTTNFTIDLSKGYYDDFIFDFGWTVQSTATTGIWVRDVPIGTYSGPVTVNPDADVPGDYGDKAYITGNGGGGVGNDDVDNGRTVLTSPVFNGLIYNDPYISYARWFYNGGGSGTPNDSLIVRIMNGIDTVRIDFIKEGGQMAQWVYISKRIKDHITPTENMRVSFDAGDILPIGHLVEAGVDHFMLLEGVPVLPVADFTADILESCAQATVQFTDLSSLPLHTWVWELPGSDINISYDEDPTAIYSMPGTYPVTLKIYNMAGMDSLVKTNYITIHEEPAATATSTPVTGGQNNGTATVAVTGGTPPYSYTWNDPLVQTTATATELAVGTYIVTVTDANGCTGTASATVTTQAGIQDADGKITVDIYPNPFSGHFYIDHQVNSDDISELTVVIYDVTGRKLKELPLNGKKGKIKIDDIEQPGLYIVSIRNKHHVVLNYQVVNVK